MPHTDWTAFTKDFCAVASQAPFMIWMTDADGNCFYLNPAWTQFTGQIEGEAIGSGWVDMVHPEDRQAAHCAFHKAIAERAPYEVDYRLWQRTGYTLVTASGRPHLDESGGCDGYVGWVTTAADKFRPGATYPPLTNRELQVLAFVADGKTAEDVGTILSISSRTVEFHIASAVTRLNALNRTHAVVLAIKSGQLKV